MSRARDASQVTPRARVTPTIELAEGRRIALTSPHLTPDSSSFASPPWAETEVPPDELSGTLRASVCNVERDYCEAVVIERGEWEVTGGRKPPLGTGAAASAVRFPTHSLPHPILRAPHCSTALTPPTPRLPRSFHPTRFPGNRIVPAATASSTPPAASRRFRSGRRSSRR